MPVFVRGYVVCGGCGKSATVRGEVAGAVNGGIELWWKDLPEGWEIFSRGRNVASAYCSAKCNKHSAVMGYADFRGKEKKTEATYDERTAEKLLELMETASTTSAVNADTILAAIEAVLSAWRKGVQPA